MWLKLLLQEGYNVLINMDKVRLVRPCVNPDYSAVLYEDSSVELIVHHKFDDLMSNVNGIYVITPPKQKVKVVEPQQVEVVETTEMKPFLKPKGTTSSAIAG